MQINKKVKHRSCAVGGKKVKKKLEYEMTMDNTSQLLRLFGQKVSY